MKNFLKKNLPESYKKSTVVSGAYSMEVGSVVRFISIKADDFTEDGSYGWVFEVSLGAYDKYRIAGGVLHILDASILNEDVGSAQNAYKIKHWKEDEEEEMAEVLRNKIIPWLSWIGEPLETINYLLAFERFKDEVSNHEDVKKYGSVLLANLGKVPKRATKYFNSCIATIYFDLGDYERALHHLKRHREFLISDNQRRLDSDFFIKTMQVVDAGINELESKI